MDKKQIQYTMIFNYGIDKLTVDKVVALSNGELKGELTAEAKAKVQACRNKVEIMSNGSKAVYGINTGFGEHRIFFSGAHKEGFIKKYFYHRKFN